MMSKFLLHKKILLKKTFEKAENSTTEKSFSGILKDLEFTLKEDFNIPLSYRTFETYYKSIVENGQDYNIKKQILDDLSVYLGYKNFKEFCEKIPVQQKKSSVEVTVSENETSEISLSEKFSKIIINITNQPIFTLPEFVTKHSNSFGILGILLVVGFVFNKINVFKEIENKNAIKILDSSNVKPTSIQYFETNNIVSTPQTVAYIPEKTKQNVPKKIILKKREKECMYWNGEKYMVIFCDEKVENYHVEQLNQDKLMLKKILKPDTLTEENSIGKVWYDKTNNKVEFFTHYGIHPSNGKTLKNVSKHILETYASK